MTDLSNITFDDIEVKIMSILWANQGKEYSQYSLFNKLVEDKYDIKNLKSISSDFKSKFLLVVRNLKLRYDDLEFNKNNNTFYIKCGKLDNDDSNTKEEYSNNIEFPCVEDFIINNNIEEEFKYIDPFNGNSIYHNIVLYSNIIQIQKLINENKFNFFIKNKNNQIPVDLSTDINITNIILKGMVNTMIDKNIILKTENNALKSKNNELNNNFKTCYDELILLKKPKYNFGYYFLMGIIMSFIVPLFFS